MEAAKRFFKGRKNGGELGLGELWMSGAFAGTVNTVVANPVEHIRISMFLPPYPPISES
jgi:solute carrier family 25 carnitine/acylcarnitine transporter 20/29